MNSFIQKIPLVLDEEDDKNLLGGLPINRQRPSGQLQNTSPSSPKSPLEYNNILSEDLAKAENLLAFYRDQGVLLFTDAFNSHIAYSVNLDPVEVTATEKIFALYGKQMDGFRLTIFIHADGTKVQRFYKNLNPKDDELILLLENNDKANIFGSVMYVKPGRDVQIEGLPIADIFTAVSGTKVNISKKSLKELLDADSFKNKATLGVRILNLMATIPHSVLSILLKFIANTSDKYIAGSIRLLAIEEKYWDPAVAEYTPKFIGSGTEKLAKKSKQQGVPGGKNVQQVIKAASGSIHQAADEFYKQVVDFTQYMPRKMQSKIRSKLRHVKGIAKDIEDLLILYSDMISELAGRYPYQLVNGYLCGLINGIIEGLTGTLEFVSMILQLTSAIHRAATNLVDSFIFLREMMENVIEAFSLNNLTEYFLMVVKAPFTIIQAIFDALGKIDIQAALEKIDQLISKTNPGQVGYFLGYTVGMIAEVILEIFATGGAAAVEKFIQFIADFANGAVRMTRKTAATLGKVTDNTVKELTARMSAFFQSLREDKAIPQLEQWIKDIIAEMKKVLGLVDEVLESIKNLRQGRMHKGGDFTKSFFENAGIRTQKYISEFTIFGQTKGYTCVANSLRMVLDDKAILRTEDFLATALKTDEEGARILDIPEALHNSYLDDLVVQAEKKISLENLMTKLDEGDKAIVSVYTDELKYHAMVIDKIENGRIFVRDPMPKNVGASYSVDFEDFEKLFKEKAVIIKK